jgi:ribose/xylose/arabinose/galactoside ABC-type transport system permease subunit
MSEVATNKRPGVVTFSAIMMFVVAGMQLVMAIDQFQKASWLKDISFGVFGQDYTMSGILDLILAIVFIIAGIAILRRQAFGRWVAIIAATLSAIRTFWFIWWFPLPAIVVIAICIMIIYAMISYPEYFD